jgi:hypothetical protein
VNPVNVNVSGAELQRNTDALHRCLATLERDSECDALVEITRVFELICTNVHVTRDEFEFLVQLVHAAQTPDVATLACQCAAWTLRSRPRLAVEVIDSPAVGAVFEWLSAPITKAQLSFIEVLFSASPEIPPILVAEHAFFQRIQQMFDSPDVPAEHLQRLLHLICDFAQSIDPDSNLVIPLFDSFVVPLIWTESLGILKYVVWLLYILLDLREEPQILEFMFSDIDLYLLERMPECDQFSQEKILMCFLAISDGSQAATRSLYERVLPRLQLDANEKLQAIILRVAGNCLSLGPELLEHFKGSGIIAIGVDRLSNGTFQTRKAAVYFFSKTCYWVKHPDVQQFLVENQVIKQLVDFLGVSKKGTWNVVLDGLTQVKNFLGDESLESELFDGVDTEEFYQILCEIYDTPGLEKSYKGLYVNVLGFLDVFEHIEEEEQ